MPLSEALREAIARELRAAGDDCAIQKSERVSGGDINQAARITTAQASYFVKWHAAAPPGFFEAEADGLRRLRAVDCLRVPEVVGIGAVEGGHPAFLILEWLGSGGGGSKSDVGRQLGEGLAAQHRQTRESFGLEVDNYIGSLPQPNTPDDSWVTFYREQRLAPQRDLAARQGRLPPERARLLDKLMSELDRWIDDGSPPALLHGDLWGGNYMLGPEGEPVLIDPAVYYGDREIELAFTRLFGGFSRDFYDAYESAYPLPPDHEERVPLYQLYHLLTHLNLFGEGYGGSVDRVLRRYVG